MSGSRQAVVRQSSSSRQAVVRQLESSCQAINYYRGSLTFSFHYRESHYGNFWLKYVQVGDFLISRGRPTVPLTGIVCNADFFKSQNLVNAGTLFTYPILLYLIDLNVCSL